MDIILSTEQVRVLGCLLEKKMATPDYYPLSLNALISACNQKVNRDPVVNYGDTTILRALDGLKQHQLAWLNSQGRVAKYKEGMADLYHLSEAEAALMCVLMLRGPQTIGELRARTDRLHAFNTLEEVMTGLNQLSERQLVVLLPRQPGQKEARYGHLLSGPPQIAETPATPLASTSPVASEDQERMVRLEERVAALTVEVEELKQAFTEFRRQFE